METISVVTEVQRRRRYSVAEKLSAVGESNEPGRSVSCVACKYGISPRLLFNWRRRMAEGGKQASQADDDVVAASEVRELMRQIRELAQVLVKKNLENEIRRDAVELATPKKTDLAAALVARGRHSMKAIAATLGVARSNLAQHAKGCSKERGPYLREADPDLLPQIRAILDERTTCSFRRVGAILNRRRTQQGLTPLKHKRIYRIMAQNHLLLTKHTDKQPNRSHEGKVITLHSNTR